MALFCGFQGDICVIIMNVICLFIGAEAAKKFNGLRTIFARHIRLVKEREPKSGAGDTE